MAKRLGASLEGILPVPAAGQLRPGERTAELDVEEIAVNPDQPRSRIDERALDELSRSIAAQGVVQPIVVRPREGGGYWLVAGERRWRATKRAGNKWIPAVVRALSERDALAVALVENVQREDLNAIDEARSVRRLIDDFGLKHHEAAAALGRSRAAISNLLRLLELHEEVQELVIEGHLEMGHARALLALDPPGQPTYAAQVVAGALSVRETEALVQRARRSPMAERAPRSDLDLPELPERWRGRIAIVPTRRGTTVRLRGLDREELDALLVWLRTGDG